MPAAERAAAWLDVACAGQPELRAEVEALLRSHEAGGFIKGVPRWALDTDPVWPVPDVEADLARLKPEEPGEQIGNYRLLEKIGEGGFGTVWTAEQEQPIRRRVALKIIKLGMDTREVIARFEQERQALAMMDHPHIAKVFDAGATQWGRPFFVMELVRGIKITDYCDEAHLPTTERLALFITVCQAVQHAHQKGIIHRDLKPSNILVETRDGAPEPKVIDFGVAKATQSQRLTELTVFTELEQMIGTPLYMSPEQAQLSGTDIDTRSDIYSLGVLLYELLTGRTPFDPETLMRQGRDEIRRAICEQEPQRPSTFLSTMRGEARTQVAQRRRTESAKLISQIRGDLDWIVMKALEKDRSRRYETANGLALDLKRHLAHEPVLARPASALYRSRRFIRRNKLAAAAAIVLAALLAGAAFSTWSFLREQEQRRAATTHAQLGQRLLYAANIKLAQQALQANNMGRARRLLDLHWPAPGEEDLRGWEWRYLWEQCRNRSLDILTQRETGSSSVSFSRDGRRLAVGYFDGRVELWDVAARMLVKVLQEKASGHARVLFSPTSDALAATAGPGMVKWHDLAAGSEKVLAKTPGTVRDLAISPDGAQLAILCSGREKLLLLETATGAMTRNFDLPRGSGTFFNNARFSPDAQHLYVSCGAFQQLKLRCLSLADGLVRWEKDGPPRRGPRTVAGFSAMAVSPDGRFLVTGTGYESGLLQVWNSETGEQLATLEAHTDWICQLNFSPDGKWMASAASDQSVRLWKTGVWESPEPLRANSDEVHSVAFSPDGALLASGSKDGVVMLWDLRAPRPEVARVQLPDHVGGVRALPGGGTLVAASARHGLSRIDLTTLHETPLSPKPAPSSFTPPNCFGIHDGAERLTVYEIGATETRPLGVCRVSPAFRFAFIYSPATRRVGWSDGTHIARVSQLESDDPPIELHGDAQRLATVTRFSTDGRFLLAVDQRGAPIVWELTTRRRVLAAERYLSPYGFVKSTYNSVRGRGLQAWLDFAVTPAAAQDGLGNGKELPKNFWPRGALTDRAFSPDGHTFAVAAESGIVGLYDVAHPQSRQRLHGHLHSVYGVAFSPDGSRLAATGDGDEAVKLWDVRTHQELLTLSAPGTFLSGVEWTDDGTTLIVGSERNVGTWQYWRAPSLAEIERVERAGGGWARGE